MFLDELMTTLGHSERRARYERPSAARQCAVAIDSMSGVGFHLTETNDPKVPLR